MNKLVRAIFAVALSVILALFSAVLSCSAPVTSLPSLSGAVMFLQTTPTPQIPDKSEAGSTDEIVIMSGVIVFIIIAPILISRKSWR